MKTKIDNFLGIDYEVPDSPQFFWPDMKIYSEFPTSCGAGKFGDTLIPDTVWGLCLSPACWVHDLSWTLAKQSWSDFFQTNNMFRKNMLKINEMTSGSFIEKSIRRAAIYRYYISVCSFGAYYFWKE